MTSLTTEARADGVHLFNSDGDLVGRIVYDIYGPPKYGDHGHRYSIIFQMPYNDHSSTNRGWKTLEAAEFYALAVAAQTHSVMLESADI